MTQYDAFISKGNWTREQTLLAFKLYCEMPFGQLDSRNKKVIELAELIRRTPSSVAMKCLNIASLDSKILESGRVGLGNASALDRQVWDEAHADWNAVLTECEGLLEHALRERQPPALGLKTESEHGFNGEERIALVKQRVKQSFFRRSVLSSYRERCCISGLSDRRFLVASHIVPWNEDASIRLHPANGICLSVIHDKAFDRHLFSLDGDFRVMLSRQLVETKDEFLKNIFLPTEDKKISLPDKFSPDHSFLARHRNAMTELEREGKFPWTS